MAIRSNNRENKDVPSHAGSQPRKSVGISFGLTFCILIVFWLIFSGKFDGFHITLGIISCLGLSALCHRFFFPQGATFEFFAFWTRFFAYLPWFFKKILRANLHVLYLTFHPNMMKLINPKIITFKTRLKGDAARTTIANCITLTPGTITIYSGTMGTIAVHCIDDRSGDTLPGEMEERIVKVFDEDE